MNVPIVLLTLDEARDLLGTSAIDLVETVSCSPVRLARLLVGEGTTRGLTPAGRHTVRAHRAVLLQVLAAGHAGIVEEQTEGALSYAEYRPERPAEALAA